MHRHCSARNIDAATTVRHTGCDFQFNSLLNSFDKESKEKRSFALVPSQNHKFNKLEGRKCRFMAVCSSRNETGEHRGQTARRKCSLCDPCSKLNTGKEISISQKQHSH